MTNIEDQILQLAIDHNDWSAILPQNLRSIAWNLAHSDALFQAVIQRPDLENKFLESNWDGDHPGSAITLVLIQSPVKLQWIRREPRAQRKLANGDWGLSEHRPMIARHSLFWQLFTRNDDTRRFLLTNRYMVERLLQYDWSKSYGAGGDVYIEVLGKILTKAYNQLPGYEFIPCMQSKCFYMRVFPSDFNNVSRENNRLNQAFLEFSVLLDCLDQKFRGLLIKDVKAVLFKTIMENHFPQLKNENAMPFLMNQWTAWDQKNNRGRPSKKPTSEIQPATLDPMIHLKSEVLAVLNKAVSKPNRWRAVDGKSPQFFTPFHGTRTLALANALKTASNKSEIKQILQNQLDIYENPKNRTKLPVIQNKLVAKRLSDDFKRHPFKGIRGYYALMKHLMKTILISDQGATPSLAKTSLAGR